MNTITEVLNTPITHQCDVLVAGGGVPYLCGLWRFANA